MKDWFHLILFETTGGPGGDGGAGAGDDGKGAGTQTVEPPEGTPEAQAGAGNEGDDPEVKKARAEAAKYRRERNELQKRVDALEGAQKTELEKAQDRATKAEKKVEEATPRQRTLLVRAIGTEIGIPKAAAADVAQLFPWDTVEDPDDEASVEKALRAFIKDRPHLVGNVANGADGGAGGGSGGGEREGAKDMNARIREAAGRG